MIMRTKSFISLASRQRVAASLVALGAAILLEVPAAHAAQVAQFQVNGKSLKTAPASASRIAPLLDALADYDRAVETTGKPPADAAQRLQKIQSLVPGAKSEIQSLLGRLRAAGELEDFNAYVEEKAKATGSGKLVSELRAAGGAAQLLQSAASTIDREMRSRQQASTMSSLILNELLDLVSVRSARAGFRSTVCGAFWFAISLGYAERHAYESCYK
jgi:hypothetical protein